MSVTIELVTKSIIMVSGRGGARKGAGRKTTWESGCTQKDTKPIRVPKAIASELLVIAHKLDRGESLESDTKSKSDDLVQKVQDVLVKWRQLNEKASPKSTQSQWSKVRQLLSDLEQALGYPLSEPNQLSMDLVTESKNIDNKSTLESVSNSNMLSALELSQRLGVSASVVSRYKTGKRKQTLEAWSKTVDPDNLPWSYSDEAQKFFSTSDMESVTVSK